MEGVESYSMEIDMPSTTVVAQQCTEDYSTDKDEDNMEIDRAVVEHLVKPELCTDESPPSKTSLCTIRNYLTMYDKQIPLLDIVQSSLKEVKYYTVNGPIGCAVLFGSEKTTEDKSDYLPSVNKDLNLMKTTLVSAGWHIKCNSGKVDKNMLIKELNMLKTRGEDLKKYSVFLFYYSGHGVAEGIVLTKSGMVPYAEIVTRVSSISSLQDKPKIFIFDCCRKRDERPTIKEQFHTFSKNQFGIEIEEAHYQACSNGGYPPRHTMLCFSASEGMTGLMDITEGSFYTLVLSHALKQFGQHLSLPEVITQVGGGTYAVAYSQRENQRPIFMSNLEKQLVLSTHFCNAPAEKDEVTQLSVITQDTQPHPTLSSIKYKGLSQDMDEIECDVVPQDPKVKPVWKSKHDVIQNIGTLGDGISVFFIYAPNPDDPYKNLSNPDELEQKNRYLMTRLFFELECHGFHILSDLHLGDTEPRNWVHWYISRICHCNFVIFVCSPAFKELFQGTPTVEKLQNVKARRVIEYRNALYAGISNESELLVEGSVGRQKFIPIILDNYEISTCVPLLFQSGTVYHIRPEKERRFCYDNRSRDFERLICHMTGINRVELDKKEVIAEVPTINDPFEKSAVDMFSGMSHEQLLKKLSGPPQGYVVAGDPCLNATGLVGSSNSATQGHSKYNIGTYQPNMDTPGNLQHSQPQISLAPPISHSLDDPSTLPPKCPQRKMYLWLSDKVVSWKFFARHLELSESDIERIVSDYRGTSEHCYQMFLIWEQHHYQQCTYQKLGEVLKNSEKNKMLYADYVQKAKEIEHIQ